MILNFYLKFKSHKPKDQLTYQNRVSWTDIGVCSLATANGDGSTEICCCEAVASAKSLHSAHVRNAKIARLASLGTGAATKPRFQKL